MPRFTIQEDDEESPAIGENVTTILNLLNTVVIPQLSKLTMIEESMKLMRERLENIEQKDNKVEPKKQQCYQPLREVLQRHFDGYKYPAEFVNIKSVYLNTSSNESHLLDFTTADIVDYSKTEEAKRTLNTKMSELRSETGHGVRDHIKKDAQNLDTTEIEKLYGRNNSATALDGKDLEAWQNALKVSYKSAHNNKDPKTMDDVANYLVELTAGKFGVGLSNRAFLRTIIFNYVNGKRASGESDRDMYFSLKAVLSSSFDITDTNFKEYADDFEGDHTRPERAQRRKKTPKPSTQSNKNTEQVKDNVADQPNPTATEKTNTTEPTNSTNTPDTTEIPTDKEAPEKNSPTKRPRTRNTAVPKNSTSESEDEVTNNDDVDTQTKKKRKTTPTKNSKKPARKAQDDLEKEPQKDDKTPTKGKKGATKPTQKKTQTPASTAKNVKSRTVSAVEQVEP